MNARLAKSSIPLLRWTLGLAVILELPATASPFTSLYSFQIPFWISYR
jgi:hypothetical protein